MSRKTCDIIIPTFNSDKTLPLVLEALYQQNIPREWIPRVIVSDDGSSDKTVQVANQKTPKKWQPIKILASRHTGAAAARNRGIAASRADILLLLGADIILRPGALDAHLNFHNKHSDKQYAGLGMIKWDPRLQPSPLMEWMLHGGSQNDYDRLLGEQYADPRHFFYGSHLSLKKELLKEEQFPEEYQSYGWEDLDLGRSLAPKLKLYVLHRALALHRHYYSVNDIVQRQRLVGKNLLLYQKRFPAAKLIPQKPRWHQAKMTALRPVARTLEQVVRRTAKKRSTPRLFSALATYNLWQGRYTNSFSTEIDDFST